MEVGLSSQAEHQEWHLEEEEVELLPYYQQIRMHCLALVHCSEAPLTWEKGW